MSIYGYGVGGGYVSDYNNFCDYGLCAHTAGRVPKQTLHVVAGDTWEMRLSWEVPEHSTLAQASFAPKLTTPQEGNVLNFTGEYSPATNDFRIRLEAAHTKQFFKGTHPFVIAMISGDEQYTVAAGEFTVSVPESLEKTADEIALAKLENVRLQRLDGGSVSTYSHGGQSVGHMSMTELNTEINRLRQNLYFNGTSGFPRMKI